MALVALLVRHRLVDILQKESTSVRAVWVMTGAAPCLANGVAAMPGHERGLIRLVALQTEGGLCFLKKGLSIGRCVGLMAAKAALLHGVVFEPCLSDSFYPLFVAVEAELAVGLEEDELVVRCVRVMALHAIPLNNVGVEAYRLLRNHLSVALRANLVSPRRKEFPMP
jgi:hypothetical protein